MDRNTEINPNPKSGKPTSEFPKRKRNSALIYQQLPGFNDTLKSIQEIKEKKELLNGNSLHIDRFWLFAGFTRISTLRESRKENYHPIKYRVRLGPSGRVENQDIAVKSAI